MNPAPTPPTPGNDILGDNAPIPSICITTWDSMATIEKQLAAVRTYMKSVDDGEAEVLIFDNGSADGTPDFLRQSQKTLPHGTIMLSKNNLGQSVSRNHLRTAAKGDFVLFLDGDVVPIPGSISEMLDILVNNDQWPGVFYDVHGDIYDEAGATPVELPITMADMSTSPVPMFHYAVYDRGFLNAHPLPEFYPFDGPVPQIKVRPVSIRRQKSPETVN